ncbi:MAG: SufE family protein [Proteobacteria bacterium]|jgi:cysteine desulfuration protein SufE|nr:SufE family protein [Pseudomonadota bacterium]
MAQTSFEEIVETFEFLDDWEDRYRYVIELGKAMPKIDTALKVESSKVEGCASQVWIHCFIEGKGENSIFSFDGESDALIVSGLISILRSLYNGLRLIDVNQVNVMAELERLNLKENLSAQRSNGLRAMIQRINSTALNAFI